jgi:hypothetical protein
MTEETEDAQTVVDRDEHHVLGTPLLTVKLGLRTEALTIATTVNPQSHRQFLIHLSRSLGPYIQIQTVLAEGSLLTIAPLGVITTGILDSLITGTTEGVAFLHTLPGHYGLRSLPTVLTDGRSSIGDATIHKHIRMVVSQDALYLTTFDCQHGVVLRIRRYCYHEQ